MLLIEEKKQDNHPQNVIHTLCTSQQFFNLKQLSRNIYDLRSTESYKQSHVIGAKTISEPLKLDKLDALAGLGPIVVYGDKENTTQDIINHLWKLSQLINIDISFYVFDGQYIDILNTFPFLCGNHNNKCIYPNMILENELYLGDGMMAENKDIIINLGITHIVNVTKMDFMLDNEIKKNIKYLKLSIDDTTMEADKMANYFETAIKFIDDAFINDDNNNNKDKSNRVFVHCMAGVSRSASVVIAYLMKSRKYTLYNAFIYVKQCRPRIMPNQGFLTRLIEYEQKIFGKSTQNELSQALGM